MSIKWSMGMTKLLISLIEHEEHLYNPMDPDYTNKYKRISSQEMIASKISEEFPSVASLVTSKAIMEKWSSLKSQFKAEEKKVKDSMRSGAAATDVYVPSVYWWELMSFLGSHSQPESSITNIQIDGGSTPSPSGPSADGDGESSGTPFVPRKRTKKVNEGDVISGAVEALGNIVKLTEAKSGGSLNPENSYSYFGNMVAKELANLAKIDRSTAERTKRTINRILLDAADGLESYMYESLSS